MSDYTALVIAVFLLAGNGFFVGAEFALIAARRSRIEPLVEAGNRRAKRTLAAMEQVSLMMAGAQLGITVCSIGLGAIGEPAVAHLMEPLFEAVGIPDAFVHPIAFAIALAIVVYLHMTIGEMVPKNLALAMPERSAMLLGPALATVVTVLKPVIWSLNAVANIILRALRVTPKDEVNSSFTADEVGRLVAESRREGLLAEDEHRLLLSALELTGRRAHDLMLPTDDLITVPVGITAWEVEDLTGSTGFSRFPVRDDEAALIGYLHVKDALVPAGFTGDRPVPPTRYRPLPPVGADVPISETVAILQQEGSHLGRVVDGSGVTLGIVALEDALEELIGEVRDAAHGA
jgi:CBS domain containing-hemolysin-like protein